MNFFLEFKIEQNMFLFQTSGGGKVVYEKEIEVKSSGPTSGSGFQTISKTTTTTSGGGGGSGGSASIEITQVKIVPKTLISNRKKLLRVVHEL